MTKTIYFAGMNHLAIDIGNTDTVFGYWTEKAELPKVLRISTKRFVSNKDQASLSFTAGINDWEISEPVDIILSSVTPAATETVYSLVKFHLKQEIKKLDKTTFFRLPLEIISPDEIGTDLVANALASHIIYRGDSIIVDFGTAMSFTTIDKNGKILGVSIAPGLQTAIKSLTSNAAQLFEVPLIMPASALGQNTEHAIQAGIMYGYDGLVRGIIQAQEKELGIKLNIIATGGLSQKIPTLKEIVHHYEPHLTLTGLRLACNYL
ncbi:MAG: type III pantothenate kinase [Saprospiraceae bacterium]